MGKLVVTEFITLDGVIDDPGGSEKSPHGGWAFQFDRGDEGDAFKFDELAAADAQLLGRVTYEGFAEAWPQMNDNPFGQKFNSMPKFVVSSTLENPQWENTTVISGDLVGEVSLLKERFEGDVLVAGSATLVRALLAHGLVDRLNLMVFPIAIGGGKRLFAHGVDRSTFELVEMRRAAEVAILTLRRRDA